MSKIYFGTNIQITNGDTLGKDTFEKNFKSNLTHVYHLPNGVKNTSNLFNGCINLKDFVGKLPDTIENMDGMFKDCKNLNIIAQIPNNVKNMKSAYENTSVYGDLQIDHSIKNLDYSFKNTKVNSVNFYVEYDSEDDETTGVSAFENCINLKILRGEIEKRNSINMFYNSSLENIDISFRGGDSSNMFRNCNNLQTANFNNAINIDNGDNMFENCINLKTVNFNNFISLNDGNNMFENCISLQTAHFNNGIVLNNANNMFKNCINLKDFDSIIKIYNGNEVFSNCKTLTDMNSLTIFNSINLFQNCTNLLNFQMNLFEPKIYNVSLSRLFNGTNIKNVILNPTKDFGWNTAGHIPSTTSVLKWEFSDEDFTEDTYIEMHGTNHSYLSDCLIRNMFSTNSHPYYKSGYFDINQYEYTDNHGEISIDQYKGGLSSFVADARYRSNPLDKNTETTITYNANVFKDIKTIYNIFYLGELNTSLFENSTVKNFITNKNNIDIPQDCFNNCTSLLNLYTGNLLNPTYMTVKNIGNNSFNNCQKLNILSTNNTSGLYTVGYQGINKINVKDLDLSCYDITNMKSVVLQNLTNLKTNGYINYFITEEKDKSGNITGYYFGEIDNITDYGYTIIDNIYRNCTINYLNVFNAKNIGNYAFYDSNIKSIILGPDVKKIGNHSFHNTIIYNFNSQFNTYFTKFKNSSYHSYSSGNYCWNQLTIYTNGLSCIDLNMYHLDARNAIKFITVNDKDFKISETNGAITFNMPNCENLYINNMQGGTTNKCIFNLKDNANVYIKTFGSRAIFFNNINIGNLFMNNVNIQNTHKSSENRFIHIGDSSTSFNGVILSKGKRINNFLINDTCNIEKNFYYNLINNFYIYNNYNIYRYISDTTISTTNNIKIYTKYLNLATSYDSNIVFDNITFYYKDTYYYADTNLTFTNTNAPQQDISMSFPTFPIFDNI